MNLHINKNMIRTAKMWMLPAVLMVALMSSCGEKKNEEKTIEQQEKERVVQERDAKKDIIRMGDYEFVDSLKENGHRYEYKIERVADDSLGVVTDEEGYRTADNAITLTIKRDGAQMFSKRYTRRAFKIGISDEDFKQYVLMNMVYDRMTTSGMQFLVSLGVGSADDMFVQFSLTVGADGSTNIVSREVFDDEEIDRVEIEE